MQRIGSGKLLAYPLYCSSPPECLFSAARIIVPSARAARIIVCPGHLVTPYSGILVTW